jgi:hypothetical protein
MKMTARRSLCCGLLLVSAGVLLSCGSGRSSKVPPPQPPDVYVAGFEDVSSNCFPCLYVAKYWKNGTPVTLGAGVYGSDADSIFVSGNDVYVAGREGSPNGDVAKYWKNGVGVALTAGAQNSVAIGLSVFVDGNDVYVAGYDRGVAMYWKNGVQVALTDGTNGAEAWSIVVSGTDVYVAGWEYKTTQIDPSHTFTTPVAEYWKNGVPTELSDPLAFGIAHSIFLSGNDIYVAGNTCQENEPPGCDLATYWKNGTPVVLPGQKPTAGASIFVSGADVYVAGNYLTGNGTAIADLWKDGMLTQLSMGGLTAANQVVVSGSDVYVAGADVNGAGYWKNGVFAPVTDGTHFASGFAMTVVQH